MTSRGVMAFIMLIIDIIIWIMVLRLGIDLAVEVIR